MRITLRLPHGETDERKRYAMPDPDALADAYTVAYRCKYYGEREPTPDETARLIMLAGGYISLTTYELGQECCVEKLRDIWRARRARPAPKDESEAVCTCADGPQGRLESTDGRRVCTYCGLPTGEPK